MIDRGMTVVFTVLGLVTLCAHADDVEPRFFKDCESCPELVRIQPGEFLMGSPEDEVIPMRGDGHGLRFVRELKQAP